MEIKTLKDLPPLKGKPSRKIESTSNYDLFVFKKGNRPVRRRVVTLMEAMRKHNQLQEYPILVSARHDGKLEIADGQHRFAAAKALKLPIFFIRSRHLITIEQIAAANALQKSWSLSDWLDSWIDRGADEYAKLKNFCGTFQLPVTVGMEVLGTMYGGEQMANFRDGKFVVNNLRFGQVVGHVLSAIRSHVPVSDLRLVRALIRVMRVKDIDIERLIKKVATHSSMFERKATWMKYVELLEGMYNANVKVDNRLSLVFEVDKAEREKRSKVVAKGNVTRKQKRIEGEQAA